MRLAELLEGEATERISVDEAHTTYVTVLQVVDRQLVEALEQTVAFEERAVVLEHFRRRLPEALLELSVGFKDDK